MNEAQGEFGSQMSQSQTFWHLTFIAHRDSVLAHLCRLYDKTDGTLSLSRFIETIKLNRGLFSDAKFKKRLKRNPHFETLVLDRDMKISTLNSELKKVLPSNRDVKKLHYLRNKVIAHTDAEVVIRGFAPGRSWPSSALIEKLLDRAAKITGTYSLHFKASRHAGMHGIDDFRGTLRLVREAMSARKSVIEKQIADLKKDCIDREHSQIRPPH